MPQADLAHFLGVLVLILAAAKLLGILAQRIGQPAVLGELLAGVLVGSSVLGLVDPNDHAGPAHAVLDFLAEAGVIILLFEIGLETDLRKLLQAGASSLAVALVGVVLPFLLGFLVCRMLGLAPLVAIMAGATLTATSVGITARVLADLGCLQDPESQVILGAAVVDDVLGLVILTVMTGVSMGEEISVLSVCKITAIAFGFLIVAVLVGRWLVPPIVRLAGRAKAAGTQTVLAMILAFGMAWLAYQAGLAFIIGAFAGGLCFSHLPNVKQIEANVAHLGHFFVPLFFVSVGAAVDVRVLNPLNAANHQTLIVGGLLILAGVAGKFAAGYAPFWFRGKKYVIGVGMIPRGEVGLIFGKQGLASHVFDSAMFSAVTVMVMVTTFLAPPLLKWLFPPRESGQ